MRLFVFDFDGTLGWKGTSYAHITKENGGLLRELAKRDENRVIFATGRPKTQTLNSVRSGGISPEEIYNVFFGGVYEDGLYVESREGQIFNALEETTKSYREIREGMFDDDARLYFFSKGYFLLKGRRLREVKEEGGCSFVNAENFNGDTLGNFQLPPGIIPLWQQENDVKQTYKLPLGSKKDSLVELSPIFDKIYNITLQYFNQRFPGWEKSLTLEKWEDAVEIYPHLTGEHHFIKGEGVAKLVLDLDKGTEVVLCCDGRNDISMVNYLSKKFTNCRVFCPSNVSKELRKHLQDEGIKHNILEEDCDKFMEGLIKSI